VCNYKNFVKNYLYLKYLFKKRLFNLFLKLIIKYRNLNHFYQKEEKNARELIGMLIKK